MTNVRKQWIAAALALCTVGACRGAYVSLWVIGSGQSLTSPSMRYSASAMSYEGKTFFGATRRWSRLWVVDGLDRTIWETKIYSDLDVEWRADGAVTWAEDSSEVVFTAEQTNGSRLEVHSAAFRPAQSAVEIIEELAQ